MIYWAAWFLPLNLSLHKLATERYLRLILTIPSKSIDLFLFTLPIQDLLVKRAENRLVLHLKYLLLLKKITGFTLLSSEPAILFEKAAQGLFGRKILPPFET